MADTKEVPPTLQGKPTPTQAELDQIASGTPPESLEPDGSPEAPPIDPAAAATKKKREVPQSSPAPAVARPRPPSPA